MKPLSHDWSPTVDRRLRRQSMALVVMSLVFGLFVIAFKAGLDATPYDAADSEGRTMGFNDRFSREHYGIILGNMSLRGTFGAMHLYEWGFVGMHALALVLLACTRNEKWMVRFCLLQPLVFPWGLFGLYVLPVCVVDIAFYQTSDREGYVDIPFVPIIAHGFWLWVAIIVGWRFHRLRKRHSRSVGAVETPDRASPAKA